MPQFDTQFFSSLIFWEVVSFGILLGVLYKFAFPAILATLEARERKIRESLEQAERHRVEAEGKLNEYKTKLSTASRDAEAVLVQAKERAQRLLEENEQRVTAETERMKAEALRDIEQARRRAVQQIHAQTTDLALLVAERVMEKNLDKADHRRLAEEALQAIAEHQKT